MSSGLSSALEAQADALFNTIWWTMDQKFGRTNRLKAFVPDSVMGRFRRQARMIWDTVWLRVVLAYSLPYVLGWFVEVEDPANLGRRLVLCSVFGPWIYHIFIYTWFLDPLRHLPGPKGHWLFGLGVGITDEDLGFIQRDFAKTLTPDSSPTGLMTYHAFGCRRVIPFTPTAVSYFTNSRNYVHTEITRQTFRRITGEGLFYVQGDEHRRQRRFLMPAFASQHIKDPIPVFWAKGCELARLLAEHGQTADPKKGLEVFNSLTRTTLDIIGLAGFGYEFGALKDESNPVAQAYFNIFDNSPETLLSTILLAIYPETRHLPFSWIRKSEKAKIVIEHTAISLIESGSKNASTDKDILGCMLKENRRLEALGENGLTKKETLAQIFTFLAAGHETTSTAIVWGLHELSEHPDVQNRLREEVHRVLGTSFDPKVAPTLEQIEQMKYLNNVCREVLRVDPPAPITARQALQEDIYEGQIIPKDTLIHFPALVVNTHPSFWGPDAEEFRPERWDELKDVPNTHFITFQHGALLLNEIKVGPRSCIGRKFAEMEMRVVLAALIGSLNFIKVQGWKVEKYSLVTMRPRNGMYLHVSKAA